MRRNGHKHECESNRHSSLFVLSFPLRLFMRGGARHAAPLRALSRAPHFGDLGTHRGLPRGEPRAFAPLRAAPFPREDIQLRPHESRDEQRREHQGRKNRKQGRHDGERGACSGGGGEGRLHRQPESVREQGACQGLSVRRMTGRDVHILYGSPSSRCCACSPRGRRRSSSGPTAA